MIWWRHDDHRVGDTMEAKGRTQMEEVPRLRTLRHPAAQLLALVACCVGVPAAGAAGAAASFVKATVRPGQPAVSLLNQGFVENVTCTRACDVTTVVSISLADAKKLGFKGGTPRVVVASSFARLKANTPSKVIFVATPQGKKLLPKAKPGLGAQGQLTAIARTNRTAINKTNWSVKLK
jgi:hypothetical protein